MAQFFAHLFHKPKSEIGEVTVRETHERITCVQVSGQDLNDLLTHFVCEKSGLRKDQIVKIELTPNVYGRGSLDQTLTAHFREVLDPTHD